MTQQGYVPDFTGGQFGNMSVDANTDTYTFPSSAESWGGFANIDAGIYPLNFTNDGSITFNASVPSGQSSDSAVVRFRFEKNPHPDVNPAYDTAEVTVSGSTPTSYTIAVPSQGENTFRSFLLYLGTRDVAVEITDIVVTADAAAAADDTAPAEPVSVNLTLTASGSAVRLTGQWWSWDPNAGPEAIDNGNGTWTVTLNPAPTENMQYLWVVDGVQENLIDNAAASECNAEIDGGSLITDYANWANRVWVVGRGDINDTYDSCAGTAAADDAAPAEPAPAEPAPADDAADDAADDNLARFTEAFGGIIYDGDAQTYNKPGSAESWAGVANSNNNIFPLTFTNGGSITFNASVPSGGDADVRFRFEKNPHPDVNPAYDTNAVTVSGSTPSSYTIDVPSQGENTFRSFLLYLVTEDVDVEITDVEVTSDDSADAPAEPAPADDAAPVNLTLTASGSVVRLTGQIWSWAPDGGPVANDNGDGTWTVTLNPAPTDNMEYLWVVDGEFENLIDNAAAGECNAEINGGRLTTDYSGFANRVWLVDSGDIIDTYGACAGTEDSGLSRDGSAFTSWQDEEPTNGWNAYGVTAAFDNSLGVNTLKIDNANGADWWSGVTIISEYQDTNLIANSTVVDVRVQAEQAGDLSFELEYNGDVNALKIKKVFGSGPGELLPGQWHDITLDFSDSNTINLGTYSASNNYHKMQIRPDVLNYVDGAKTSAASTYYVQYVKFDRASIVNAPPPDTSIPASPVPTDAADSVLSIFSNTYTNLENTEFNPNWGQSTQVTVGNDVLTYAGLNYQGTDIASSDVSGYAYIRLDIYTADATDFQFTIISPGKENLISLADQIVLNQWVTVEIALSEFVADLTQVNQLKVEGNGTVTLDNIYFGGVATPVDDSSTTPTPAADKYSNTSVKHNGVEAEVNSEILLTIGKINSNTLRVTAVSADSDPLDLLLIDTAPTGTSFAPNNQVDATTDSPYWNNGTAYIDMIYSGDVPDSTQFQVLWSKESFAGNWMISADAGSTPVIDTTGPVVIDGYYPLYTSQAAADADTDGNGSSHTHDFNGSTYYMPNGLVDGVTYWHGNYGNDGSTPPADGDSGTTDGGSGTTDGDSGTTDGDSGTTSDSLTGFEFTNGFGEFVHDNNTFQFPSTADSWAGVANTNTDLYPMKLGSTAPKIKFNASVPSGGDVVVRFRFEENPHPNNEPSYNTPEVTVSGATSAEYTINLVEQGENTFSSFILYLNTQDVPVVITDVTIEDVRTVIPTYGQAGDGSEGNSINDAVDAALTLNGFNFYRQASDSGSGENGKWQHNSEQQGYSNINNTTYSRVNGGAIEIDLIANPQWEAESDKPVFVSSRLITIDENERLKITPNSQLTITFSAILPIPKNSDGTKINDFPIWPALWIMGRNVVGDVGLYGVGNNLVRWPYCSEIDVMEWNGRTNNYSTAVHYFDDDVGAHQYKPGGNKIVSDGNSHDYKVVITNTDSGNITPARSIQFFFDDTAIQNAIDLTDSKYDDFFKDHRSEETFASGVKYYSLLMNIAYGGQFVNGVTDAQADHDAFTNGATAKMTISNIETNLATLATETDDINDPVNINDYLVISDGPVMNGNFDGTTVTDNVYTFPSAAVSHAGFANNNASLRPMVVGDNARIIFEASVPSGGDVDVKFKFEANPYPNNQTQWETDPVTVSGATEKSYIINLDGQGDQTFNSFLMYLITRDVPVEIKNIRLDKITVASGTEDAIMQNAFAISDGLDFTGTFNGTNVTAGVYSFPSSADSWAGFANLNTAFYPMSIHADGGSITFDARVLWGDDTGVKFKFEKNPHPDTEPDHETPTIIVSGNTTTSYTINVPEQDNNTFSSFLLYLDTRDSGVEITNIQLNGIGVGGAAAEAMAVTVDYSTALADPYIYPMRSSIPVKLPDAEACYRLYQSNKTFINAEVAIATKEHGNRMMEFVEKLGYETNDVIADGYFFSKFFIADGKNKMVVDLREKSFSLLEGSDKHFFHLSENNNNAGNKDWNGKAKNVVVEWVTEEGNQMKATVSFFANPHIENGISLSVSNLPQKALGLCVSNYRPKLMRIPSLTTEKHGKIARQVKKSRNPFQKIAIQSNREKWIMKK